MKTTLELPDELMRAVRIRAAQEDRKLNDVVGDLVRRGLADDSTGIGPVATTVALPLIECAHEARPVDEMTPARVAEILAEADAGSVRSVQ